MKQLFAFFLMLSLAAETSFVLEHLVPTPQKIERKGDARYSGFYTLTDRSGFPEPAGQYLKSELKTRLGWVEKNEKGATNIEMILVDGEKNPEFYTLSLSDGAIRVSAATVAGVHRAVGRLIGMIEQLRIVPGADGKTVFPALSIRDWPDFPFRGFHFQIGGPWSQSRFRSVTRLIDMLGRLGYNHIMLELGGRIECPAYPEITRRPAWPDEKIRELIAFAGVRGVKALPAINGPGHMSSGPRIFPLSGIREDDKKAVKELVMDLGHPEFFPRWFAYIDRVVEVFGKTEYFSIGTDEFHDGSTVLEKKLNRATSDYYPEFLARTAEHLAKKGIKTCAWHDMMVDKKKYTTAHHIQNEAVNGYPGTLEKVPENIAIMYWYYGKLGRYPALEEIRSAKPRNELWITVFDHAEGAGELFRIGKKMGVTHVMGSLWGFPPHRIGVPAAADFAWNLKNPYGKDRKYFDLCNDRLFYSRPAGKRPPVKQTLPKEPLVLADCAPKEMVPPWNAVELAKKKLFVHVPGSFDWGRPVAVHTDRVRDSNGLWIYTPEYGKSTRTNIWGQELAVVGGVITKVSGSVNRGRAFETGNMEIPRDGVVLSMRGPIDIQYQRSGDLADSARPGKELKLYEIPEKMEALPKHDFQFPKGCRNVVMRFTVSRPFDRKALLAEIVVADGKGKKSTCRLTGRDLITTGYLPARWDRFLVSAGEHPVVELEYSSPADLHSVEIQPAADGAFSGLTLLGIELR